MGKRRARSGDQRKQASLLAVEEFAAARQSDEGSHAG